MAQSTIALLCVGSLLAWDNAVVIPCDHPASPFARSAPPIVVPPFHTLGIEAVKPDLAEEAAKSAHQHKATSAKAAGAQHQHKAASAKGGAAQHQHQPASAKGGARQHEHKPASVKASAGQHQPSSTHRGTQQHQH
jgi:hypothetical protein